MTALRSISVDAGQRARRWDAVVLGSGVASLVAAARLGMRELRVLVIEEQAAAELPGCLREPPLFVGTREGGILDTVLHELRVPLIDRRRFVTAPLAYQVVGPELRLDVGEHSLCASELVAWGLAKPDEAEALVTALDNAALTERELLLRSSLVRTPGLRGLARGAANAQRGPARRGLPAEVAEVSPELGRILAAQVRALGNHASGGPSSECCARLLGAALRGGVELDRSSSGLIPVLRRRVEALYGEFRGVSEGFELVTAGGLPGIALRDSGEIWLGRALVLGGSPLALAQALGEPELAKQLGARAATVRRRTALRWRLPRAELPEGMAERVILLTLPDAADPQDGVATLTVAGTGPRARTVDLVVRVLLAEDEDESAARARIEALLRELMPFAGEALEPQQDAIPLWDDDDWLEDQPAGSEWPGEAVVRVHSRPPVYRLDRPAVAGLGLEGELLLGWRSGDVIAAELE
jgi:hypothetical protein